MVRRRIDLCSAMHRPLHLNCPATATSPAFLSKSHPQRTHVCRGDSHVCTHPYLKVDYTRFTSSFPVDDLVLDENAPTESQTAPRNRAVLDQERALQARTHTYAFEDNGDELQRVLQNKDRSVRRAL